MSMDRVQVPCRARRGGLRMPQGRVLPLMLAVACFAGFTSPALTSDDGLFTTPARALAQADVAETGAARAAGQAELKALTNQVLQSLGAVTGAGAARPVAAPSRTARQPEPADYQSLMNALTTLVEKATRQGKSSEDIFALIQEALASQDDEMLDALISQAGGKVAFDRLMRALVQKAALQVGNDPYTRMLQAEGESTSVIEDRAGNVAASMAGGASMARQQGGQRIITVQPGDTLGIIALREYGNAGRWRDIFEANRDRLRNPDLVPAGISLRLP